MKYYIDITLLPSDEIGIHFLWSKVMMQVHLALVEIQDENSKVSVAVSFPEYRMANDKKPGFVGKKLRVFAEEKTNLERLGLDKWLGRLKDYVHVKAIANVPEKIAIYESFHRRSKYGSVQRHIQRRLKRHGGTLQQAEKHYAGYKIPVTDKALPYIQMKSLQSNRDFCMRIARKEVDFSNQSTAYSTYGLSADGVLPKF